MKLGLGEVISLATLFLTLVVSGLYPFIVSPILDYEVSYERLGKPKSDIQGYLISVTNWGLSPAKNVIFSLTSDNVRFYNFTSQPFLGNNTKSNTTVLGNALFSISVLPPRSDTIIHFKADKAKTNQPLITYVRSDEKVGYHDIRTTIGFYVGLGVLVGFAFIYTVFIKTIISKQSVVLVCVVPILVYYAIFTYLVFPR